MLSEMPLSALPELRLMPDTAQMNCRWVRLARL